MSYYRSLIEATIPDPLAVSQVAHYPFDTNANDLINSLNGISTSITYGTPAKIGIGSAGFGGNPANINIPYNSLKPNFNFGLGSFSINFWIYKPSTTTNATIFSKRDGSGNIEWQINLISSVPSLFLYSANSTTTTISVSSGTTILTANDWTMVTFTFSGGTNRTGLKCYINGVDRTATAAANTYVSMSNTIAPLWLGRQGNLAASFFIGRLDQTRIWKGRVLNQTEIDEIFNTLY